MSTIDVLNAEGAIVPVELPLVPGRSAAATSRPVALSTEDKAALDLLHTDLSAAATAANQATANTALAAIQTATAGNATSANQATAQTNFGAVADAAWSGTGSGSLIAIQKYLAAKIEAVRALLAGTLTANIKIGGSDPDLGPGTAGTKTVRVAVDTSQMSPPGQQPIASATTVIPPSDANFPVVDGGTAFGTVWGVVGVPFASADQHLAVASVTDAPTSTKHIVIDDLILSVDTAMTVTFKEETSGTIMFGPWYCPASPGPIQITLRGKKRLPTADKKLQVITSVAGNINVQVGYHSEA